MLELQIPELELAHTRERPHKTEEVGHVVECDPVQAQLGESSETGNDASIVYRRVVPPRYSSESQRLEVRQNREGCEWETTVTGAERLREGDVDVEMVYVPSNVGVRAAGFQEPMEVVVASDDDFAPEVDATARSPCATDEGTYA